MKGSDRVQDALPIFHLSIPDIETLGSLTMPFAKHGGFFIPTEGDYCLGDSVFVLMQLPGIEKEENVEKVGKVEKKFAAMTSVFWVNNHPNTFKAGIGVRFSHQDNQTGDVIKALLKDAPSTGLGFLS